MGKRKGKAVQLPTDVAGTSELHKHIREMDVEVLTHSQLLLLNLITQTLE